MAPERNSTGVRELAFAARAPALAEACVAQEVRVSLVSVPKTLKCLARIRQDLPAGGSTAVGLRERVQAPCGVCNG